MKKNNLIGILLLICFCFTTNLKAQNSTIKEKQDTVGVNLQGIWQICSKVAVLESGKYKITTAHYMKIISPDMSFYNLFMGLGGQSSVITALGKCRIIDKETFVEDIARSITDPEFTGNSNEIKYKFVSPNLLMLHFNLPSGREWNEMWVRVVQPNVKQTEIMKDL